jgi:two-component system sensor histidine kinase BaeS
MPDRRRRAPHPLAWRLLAAFVAISVGAVGLFGLLMILVTDSDVNALANQQKQAATAAIVASVESTYARHDRWVGTDLHPALALAAATGARIEILDLVGARVTSARRPPPAGAQSLPIVVDGATVGKVLVGFDQSGLTPADSRFRHRLLTGAGVVAVIAALAAVALAVIVAARISRPLQTLTRAVRAIERGGRSVRIGPVTSSAELAALASGFDQMADALDRQDQLRQALVADVAHELRTPIAILQATCEAVIDGITQPDMAVVTSMHEEVLRLSRRVADLATLTSAETAGLRLIRSPLDIREVAADAAATLEHLFSTSQVELIVDLTPATVTGDQARLFQVISNLLTNAAKFTPAGGTVHLTVRPEPNQVVLEVADTGIGISPNDINHVFERFWRSRSSPAQGSGVGLAVVAELVAAHHGTVTVSSAPGHGSLFTVKLPT